LVFETSCCSMAVNRFHLMFITAHRFEEEQRRQDWSENQQYQSSYGSGSSSSSGRAAPPGDPMGYYNVLGVSKDASVQEIQSAFRGLAMKWRKIKI